MTRISLTDIIEAQTASAREVALTPLAGTTVGVESSGGTGVSFLDFPAGTSSTGVGQVSVPAAWATFDVVLVGVNRGLTAGDVRFRLYGSFLGIGQDARVLTQVANVTATAGASWATQEIVLTPGLTVVEDRLLALQVMRRGADATDTLAESYAVIKAVVRRTS